MGKYLLFAKLLASGGWQTNYVKYDGPKHVAIFTKRPDSSIAIGNLFDFIAAVVKGNAKMKIDRLFQCAVPDYSKMDGIDKQFDQVIEKVKEVLCSDVFLPETMHVWISNIEFIADFNDQHHVFDVKLWQILILSSQRVRKMPDDVLCESLDALKNNDLQLKRAILCLKMEKERRANTATQIMADRLAQYAIRVTYSLNNRVFLGDTAEDSFIMRDNVIANARAAAIASAIPVRNNYVPAANSFRSYFELDSENAHCIRFKCYRSRDLGYSSDERMYFIGACNIRDVEQDAVAANARFLADDMEQEPDVKLKKARRGCRAGKKILAIDNQIEMASVVAADVDQV